MTRLALRVHHPVGASPTGERKTALLNVVRIKSNTVVALGPRCDRQGDEIAVRVRARQSQDRPFLGR
jgi:hypothetical protein